MLLELTKEELQRIQEIQASYQPEREALRKQLIEASNNKNKEERKKLLMQQVALIDRMEDELQAFTDKCQRERFAQIAKGGASCIIENAKQQAPEILAYIHKNTMRDFSKLDSEALTGVKIGTYKKDGSFLLNANYAAAELKSELRLHIEALLDTPQLQELLSVIIEAVEESTYTDNEEIINEEKAPLEVMRFRRRPLTDVTLFGLMNDKTNAQLLQDGDIFQQEANGQITLRWAVNQAPKTQEAAVPVYMALTYEGTDYKVTKKLTSYDKQVYEAVATRFFYWNTENPQKPLYITPQEIWRTMNGKASKDGKAKPSAAQVKKICASLDKMRFTRFNMNISNEIAAFNLSINDERINGGNIETYVLNSSKVEFTTDKGNVVQGYRIGEEPILYTYNRAKKRVLYVPYEMLDTSQYTSDSENVAEFKGYLLQQIQLMKNAIEDGKGSRFKRNNIILIESIYKSAGILPPEERVTGEYANEATRRQLIRRMRKTDREKIEGLLDAWKAKGWIKGYTVLNDKNEPIKEKQQAKGYKISI